MAAEPANPKLWHTLVAQAKAKYATYPSPGASHWVHQQYVKLGGKFIDPAQARRRQQLSQQFAKKREERNAKDDDKKRR